MRSRLEKGENPMQLAQESFSSTCEHILSAIAISKSLTHEEATMIQYYCLELLNKISPALSKPY
jgi:hypothetical protein